MCVGVIKISHLSNVCVCVCVFAVSKFKLDKKNLSYSTGLWNIMCMCPLLFSSMRVIYFQLGSLVLGSLNILES